MNGEKPRQTRLGQPHCTTWVGQIAVAMSPVLHAALDISHAPAFIREVTVNKSTIADNAIRRLLFSGL
jgi:hypothetical protein